MIRYTELCEINEPQAKEFKEHGWCVYTECDGGGTYYRKGYAWVNRIGYLIFESDVDMDDMEYSDLKKIGIYDEEFSKEVRQITKKYENHNYHYHIKGKLIDEYECIRTYSKEKAKEILKFRMKYMKEKDPSIRAYRFGIAKDNRKFWKILNGIKQNYLSLCGLGDMVIG